MGKKVVFTFGRFQVPTKGHEELIRFVMTYAKSHGAEGRIYPSKSQDANKNPLPYQAKVQFLRTLFPWANIVDDAKAVNAFAICRDLSNKGYDDVTFVVGDDRVGDFENSIRKYILPKNDPKFDKTKNYAFKNFKVISSGARHKGVSGTQMRAYIRAGKFDQFMKVAPTANKTLARRIFTTAKQNLHEEFLAEAGMSRKDFDRELKAFVSYTCKQLNIKHPPHIVYKEDKGEGQPSFGGYAPHSKTLMIYTKNRHPMDIFRTVAHELVHHKQNEDGKLGKDIAKEGSTGSDIENEANSEAGKVMRYYGRENPFYLDMTYVAEHRAIILAGTPGSGKDRILKETISPFGFVEVNADEFKKWHSTHNVVINGANDYNRVSFFKEELEKRGYKTMMVFVNTSDEVSKQRNEARAFKGGRSLNEVTRFTKWQDAQNNLERFDKLFEKVVEVKNDLDLNLDYQIIYETYMKLVSAVSEEIRQFVMPDADSDFEKMLCEVGGAGNWGTPKLTNRYKKDTPGQEPGPFKKMRVLRFKKMKEDHTRTKPLSLGSDDRIGPEIGLPKSPTMGAPFDDPGSTTGYYNDPISRWMVKEETRRMFKKKYGELAEKKIHETADRLRKESLTDPYTGGGQGMTPNSANVEDMRADPNAEGEKSSLFKIKKKTK